MVVRLAEMPRVRAADVYLIEQWSRHTEEPIERRNKIFREFIRLGMRGRWKYHAQAEDFYVGKDEKEILQYRTQEQTSIAFWLTENVARVLFTRRKLELTEDELDWCTDWGEGELVCDYDDIDALPERVYSLTAFDHPDDAEEARNKDHDQSLWVSGLYWIVDNELKILWVDEFGETIREKICLKPELEEGAKAFDNYKPFESSWWTEATRVGRYATEEWWH